MLATGNTGGRRYSDGTETMPGQDSGLPSGYRPSSNPHHQFPVTDFERFYDRVINANEVNPADVAVERWRATRKVLADLVQLLGFPLDDHELDERLVINRGLLTVDMVEFLNCASGRRLLLDCVRHCVELGFENDDEMISAIATGQVYQNVDDFSQLHGGSAQLTPSVNPIGEITETPGALLETRFSDKQMISLQKPP